MLPMVTVCPLPLAEIMPLRWRVLRPGFPREEAGFAGDDAPETQHFGAFIEGTLAGVASIYLVPLPESPADFPAWQVRGMAAEPAHQRRGVGRALVAECESVARGRGGVLIWCNARRAAVGFYSRCGWSVIGAEFSIETAGPHFRMVKRL
jgi:GNAT superfamily N-acetyltransferase